MLKVHFCELYLKINQTTEEEKTARGSRALGTFCWECCGFRPEFTTAGPSFLRLEFPTKSLFVWTDGPGQCHTHIRLHRADLRWQERRSAVCQSWCSNIYCGWNVLLLTIDGYSRWPARTVLTYSLHSTSPSGICQPANVAQKGMD